MSKTTPILLTTATLSGMADDLLALLARHPTPSKSAILTAMARRVRGPRADWGHLTRSDTPIVAQGAERHAALLAGVAQAALSGTAAGGQAYAPGRTVYAVLYDERDDWARAPFGAFATLEDAVEAVLADSWIRDPLYSADEIRAGLLAHQAFTFYSSDDTERNPDGDASPFSVSILPLVLPPMPAAPMAAPDGTAA